MKAKSDPLPLRPVVEADIPALADLWYRGWQLGHAKIAPHALTNLRTADSFEGRIRDSLDQCFVSGATGAPTAFVRIRGSELDQFYVDSSAVGSGMGRRLMDAAVDLMRSLGITRAHLICAAGNNRAEGFYTAMGWENRGVVVDQVETADGPFSLEVIRFENTLQPKA